MKLTVTINWALDFIDRISAFDEVEWVRGRLYRDEVGGQLLPSNFHQFPNRKTIEKSIRNIHAVGKKFTYALNGHCLGNKEYTNAGQKRILELIKWIDGSGADAVVVNIPHLVQVIKGQFPRLKVEFGTSRVIGELQRIKYYDHLGVDSIAFRPDANRDFALLALSRKVVQCGLKLTVNSLCLHCCNFASDHENLLSHLTNFTAQGAASRYYHYLCNYERLKSLDEVIKAPFIRPEDIAIYESRGYNDFIIEPNSSATDDVVKIIKAYLSRSYDGNLLELMAVMGERPFQDDKGGGSEGSPYVDNKKLNGFLKYHVQGQGDHCSSRILCEEECGQCKVWMDKALEYRESGRSKLLKDLQKRITKIEDGIYV
ncbi:MAG: hypothetical protein WCI27_04740 [Candidatus Omnitrophota bacterium]